MSAKIGLIDVDSHKGFPNLALMKLSAWHKSVGDTVEWYNIFVMYLTYFKINLKVAGKN